jgi:hypothetical protein
MTWEEMVADLLDMVAEVIHRLATLVRNHARTSPTAKGRSSVIVEYMTTIYNPPYAVTLRSDQSDWQDVPMERVDGPGRTTWIARLETERPEPVEFKLVLDGTHWMAGPNQVGRTSELHPVMSFDDDDVHWE